MHIPSAALGACLLAGVERDTRGCVLEEAERFNYYPATPMVVISWIFEGTLHMVEEGGSSFQPMLRPALPRLVVSGPQRRPSVSWSPGEVHALSVGFYPEAIGRLIGRPIDPYFDQHLPLETVAPPALLQACEAVLGAADQDPFAVLEAQFQPLWREPRQASPAPYLGNWVRLLATRATHSTAGQSLRQWQRRVRDWTGQSYRDLQLFVRVEEAFIRRTETYNSSAPDLSDIAADAGFADQSHMGREVRRVTGLSPARFGERLANAWRTTRPFGITAWWNRLGKRIAKQGELLAEFRPQLGDDFVDSRTIARGRFNTGLYKGPPDEQCHVSPIEIFGGG